MAVLHNIEKVVRPEPAADGTDDPVEVIQGGG